MVRIQRLHCDIDQGIAFHNESATSLNHRDIVPMRIVILGDVMARVTATHYNYFSALGTFLWTRELG